MRKILLSLILGLLALLVAPGQSLAAENCQITLDPQQLTQDTPAFSVKVKSTTQPAGNYNVTFEAQFIAPKRDADLALGSDGQGTARFNLPSLTPGNYKIYVKKSGSTENICNPISTTVIEKAQQSCQIRLASTPPITPDTNIEVQITGISPGDYQIYINGKHEFTNTLPDSAISLGSRAVGTYNIGVKKGGIAQCPEASVTVSPRGSTGGGAGGGGAGLNVPALLSSGCNDSTKINTAIGCIPIGNPGETITFFLRWAIGISGGIAFLLIVWAAIQMMTAQGDPQKLQAGREVLTAAISGLIFIIFSVFLLNLIGVKILQLPGF